MTNLFIVVLFSAVCTLPTFQGKRIIAFNFWAKVRQPNHLGEILLNTYLIVPLLFNFAWPPAVAMLFTSAIIIHRTKRLDHRNAIHYNSSWTRYCQRVKYILLPTVY